MLKQCLVSPATLEVLLNSYPSVPPCEWMESLSVEGCEVGVLSLFIYPAAPCCSAFSAPP